MMTGEPPFSKSNTHAEDHQGVNVSIDPLVRSVGGSISGLYLHIPFCFHKCHYCDFYSIVDDAERQAAFAERMIDELAAVGRCVRGAIRTIFVGGGTPTLLEPTLWSGILDAMRDAFDLSALAEFTVEANPETVTPELLDTLAAGGVNRLSIGAQSFDDRHLKTLERWHDPRNVDRAVGLARDAGIGNVNLDLIFAVPGQSVTDWNADLDRALALDPTHLSCYSLMFEPNTPLTKKLELGRIDRCDESNEAAMFEATIERLADAGFDHYEVSNYARAGKRCQHNLLYWRNGNSAAIGPSASGHVDGVRWKNVPHLGRYLATEGPCPVEEVEHLDADASLGEQLMLRFRLLDGVENDWLDKHVDDRRRERIDSYVAAGHFERTETHTRLTRRGLMIADGLFAELL